MGLAKFSPFSGGGIFPWYSRSFWTFLESRISPITSIKSSRNHFFFLNRFWLRNLSEPFINFVTKSPSIHRTHSEFQSNCWHPFSKLLLLGQIDGQLSDFRTFSEEYDVWLAALPSHKVMLINEINPPHESFFNAIPTASESDSSQVLQEQQKSHQRSIHAEPNVQHLKELWKAYSY